MAVAALASCNQSPQAPPGSESNPTHASGTTWNVDHAKLPGEIWFLRDGPTPSLVRIADGVRDEMIAHDLMPTSASLPDGRSVAIALRDVDGTVGQQLVLVAADSAITPIGPLAHKLNDPVVGSNGAWIVVAAEQRAASQLLRIDIATATVTTLTDDRAGSFGPASLGGDALAFVSRRDGNSEIYRTSVRGGAATRLTRDPHGDWDPTPSPDRATIAFLSDREGPARIFLMDRDGANQRRLTQNTDSFRHESQIAWSPDGTMIAYGLARGPRRHVWLRHVASGREQDLTPDAMPSSSSAAYPGVIDVDPTFSPDGRWVAVSRTRGHDTDLWAIPVGLGEPVRITTGRYPDRLPHWR